MEEIIIKDNKTLTHLFLNNHNINGYSFFDGIIYPITEMINYFKLSTNHSDFKLENGYLTCIDYETGLKHFYKDGIEDLELLFEKNGCNDSCLIGNNKNNSIKKFNIKNKVIICSYIGLIMFSILFTSYSNTNANIRLESNIDYKIEFNIDDIKTSIFNSEYLTKEEKEYLFNNSFLDSVINTVNTSKISKFRFQTSTNNISIKPLDKNEERYNTILGSYNIKTPSVMYIKNYNGITDANKDTIAHEFVHLCQDSTGYNLIIEACAEIISKEYYSDTYLSCYFDQIKLVKKLMEIIGSEAIWHYNFTGDFSKIEDRVKPYLTENEYNDFLECLSFDYSDYSLNEPKYERLNEILGILYKNIYNDDINNNIIISLINKKDLTLKRYYFNKDFINKENSYYLDKENGTYETLTLEDAIKTGMVEFLTIHKIPLTKEEAFNFVLTHNFVVERKINTTSHNIILLHRTNNTYSEIVTIIVDGIKYENVDIDKLVEDGIIDVDYYLINSKSLTYHEYINHLYLDDELYTIKAHDTIIEDETVTGFVPKKVYLPLINNSSFD